MTQGKHMPVALSDIAGNITRQIETDVLHHMAAAGTMWPCDYGTMNMTPFFRFQDILLSVVR